MPRIKPRSAEDCIDFIKKHRAEIERGDYDLEIEPNWVKSFELSDINFLIRFCPASREEIASSPFTPAEILEAFSKDEDVREAVAGNPRTPEKVLRTLAKDRWTGVREAVGLNPNTPVDILEVLSRDGEYQKIRIAVGRNPNTPKNILEVLSRDVDRQTLSRYDVRIAVAGNPSTPVNILKELENINEDSQVRGEAYKNPNFPKTPEPWCFIATAVYGTPDTPEVIVLRDFRDTKLTNNPLGRIFIEYYYKYSPFAAKVIKNNVFIKSAIRVVFINPLVKLVMMKGWDK